MSRGGVSVSTGGASGATPALLAGVALVSGFCALGYEVLYVRHLTTLLGDGLHVHAALLSTFLVGVGAGAWLAHRFHGWLWAFELGSGLYAVALPWLTRWIGGQPAMIQVTGSTGATIALTVGLLVAPSLMVGFSLPLLSSYLKACRRGELAFRSIYAVYNFGAFAGILLVEFLVVRAVGITVGLTALGGLNAANGLVLLWIRAGRLSRPGGEPIRPAPGTVWALALASAGSAAFQMLLLKTAHLVFGPLRESFALTLAVILLGITLGTVLASRSRLRFETALRFLPVALGGAYLLHPLLASLYQGLLSTVGGSVVASVAARAVVVAAYGLLPMMLFGSLIPALMSREEAVDREAGWLLWVSSLANAVGYLAYVTVLHERMSAAVLLTGIAVLAIVASQLAGRRWRRFEVGVASAGMAALLVLLASWSEESFHLSRFDVESGEEVRVFKGGSESATLVGRGPDRWVTYNGHPSIYAVREGRVNVAEVVSGVIPALAAPELGRVMVLGVGTGITAGTAASVFDHADVVEINEAFVEMLPALADVNLDLASNPEATVWIADGRAFLVGHPGRYDAIVNSIPAPTYFSAGKVYTLEFYQRVADALKPEGVFSTWLTAGRMTPRGIETVLATLARVFPRCDLRLMDRDYYMATCTRGRMASRSFDELPAPPELEALLARGLEGLELDRFFRDIRVSENVLGGVDPSAAVNTDAFPVLEFQVTRGELRGGTAPAPFEASPERFGVDPVGDTAGLTVEELAHRAEVFRRLDSRWFTRWFEPLLQESPELREAWRRIRARGR